MENEEFLSEATSASWAGVSAQTLRQFADVGYLRMGSSRGETGYNRSDIQRIFGVDNAAPTRPSVKPLRPLEAMVEVSSDTLDSVESPLPSENEVVETPLEKVDAAEFARL